MVMSEKCRLSVVVAVEFDEALTSARDKVTKKVTVIIFTRTFECHKIQCLLSSIDS